MAGLGFARDQLEKQGWKEGKGLGKEEDGITKAIKVGIKNDTQGVGYKISDQFTFHWWDHIFNKTAKSIVVEEDKDGIQVTRSDSTDQQPISNKRPTKHSQKALLYGRFVKASASTSTNVDSDSDSDSETEMDFSTGYAEDIVFKRCGGRTAHKGARHGLKLNGKLRRIEEHDKIAVSAPCSRTGSPDVTKEHDINENTADLLHKLKSENLKDFKSYSDSEEYIKKKKKKRKEKSYNKEFKSELEESAREKRRKKKEKLDETSSENPQEFKSEPETSFREKKKKDRLDETGSQNSEGKKNKKKRRKSNGTTINDSHLESTEKKNKRQCTSDEEDLENKRKLDEKLTTEKLRSERKDEEEVEIQKEEKKRKKKRKTADKEN